jgi:hypothetical protein
MIVMCTRHVPQSQMVQVIIDPQIPCVGGYLCMRCMQRLTVLQDQRSYGEQLPLFGTLAR